MSEAASIALIFGVLLCMTACGRSTEFSEIALPDAAFEMKAVNYCEIAMNPEKFSGQTIVLRGVFMLQFEASHFVSFVCKPKISFTAAFDAPPCNDRSVIEPWDWSSPMTDRAHGVVVRGYFENKIYEGHTTGELPRYYKFNVDCIDKLTKLGTLVVFPKEEANRVKERIKEFEN